MQRKVQMTLAEKGISWDFWKQAVDCGINRRYLDWKHWLDSADAEPEGDLFLPNKTHTHTDKQTKEAKGTLETDGRYGASL